MNYWQPASLAAVSAAHERLMADLVRRRADSHETLFRPWALRHAGHIHAVARLVGSGIPENVDRYRCAVDGAILAIRTDLAFDGGVCRMLVTAEGR